MDVPHSSSNTFFCWSSVVKRFVLDIHCHFQVQHVNEALQTGKDPLLIDPKNKFPACPICFKRSVLGPVWRRPHYQRLTSDQNIIMYVYCEWHCWRAGQQWSIINMCKKYAEKLPVFFPLRPRRPICRLSPSYRCVRTYLTIILTRLDPMRYLTLPTIST